MERAEEEKRQAKAYLVEANKAKEKERLNGGDLLRIARGGCRICFCREYNYNSNATMTSGRGNDMSYVSAIGVGVATGATLGLNVLLGEKWCDCYHKKSEHGENN